MRGHTRSHHIDYNINPYEDKPVSAKDVIKEICGDRPEWSVMLKGLRNREGLTQKDFGDIIGVKQGDISKMEHGKKTIGKNIAKRMAEVFKTDYRLFL